jgi:hypothetical protein
MEHIHFAILDALAYVVIPSVYVLAPVVIDRIFAKCDRRLIVTEQPDLLWFLSNHFC